MKITVKNLKTFAGREGGAYDCVVLADGVPFVHAHDDGNGGMVHFDYSRYNGTGHCFEPGPIGTSIKEWMATQPKIPYGGGMHGKFQPDLDHYVAEAIDALETEERLRRLCSRNVVVRRPGAPEGHYTTYKLPAGVRYAPAMGVQILTRNPKGSVIVNDQFVGR